MDGGVRIGIFDSGIGGLSVLSSCVHELPRATFLYFGDNRNVPYGSRPSEEIYRLVRSAVLLLRREGAEAVVLACNTATAVCAESLRKEFAFPIIGMEPAVRPAAAVCKNVLVLCTPRTAESKRLSMLISRFPQCRFTVFPAERLAGAIESALMSGESFDLSGYLPEGNYDGVVLGCTHYVFFREQISTFYHAPVFDGNAGTVRQLKSLLSVEKGEWKWSENAKTNISLRIGWSGSDDFDIIFLGSSAKDNANLFKQTFK